MTGKRSGEGGVGGRTQLILGLNAHSQEPQQEVIDLYSDFCSWEFDICCFPLLSPGSSPDLAPSLEQGGCRYHMSITVFALVVPYVALRIFSACSSNLATEI